MEGIAAAARFYAIGTIVNYRSGRAIYELALLSLEPELVNLLRIQGIDSQTGGIDSWAL